MARNMSPLWPETAPNYATPGPPLDRVDCDVAIVGAGFTGLRAGLLLAEKGVRVAIFDAGEVGHGASGRSGGQVNPMLPVADPEDLRRTVGDTYFSRLTEVSLQSADELFELVRTYGIMCDARQNGWLRADHSETARQRARHAALAWNVHGADFEFIDGDEVSRLTGSPAYRSATYTRRGGAVHPLALVRGLAIAAARAGAQIFGQSRVSALQRIDQRWHMQANGRPVNAEQVILATNGYTDGLFPGLKQSILPLMPIQIATDPLPDAEIAAILPQGQTISDTRRLIMYARREPDNRLVFGGIGFPKLFERVGGLRWLRTDVQRVFPSVPADRWIYHWGGYIALTADRIPHLHEPAPGMLAGLGYNGRGVAMSVVMGRLLAERALGTDPDQLAMPVTGIDRMPFRLPQLIGAAPAMAAMRIRDKIEFR